MSKGKEPATGFGRLFQIGGMALKVGSSFLAHTTSNLFIGNRGISPDILLKNATRMMNTLADLKGGAMKIGQMLSLQEGLFPPEIIKVLSVLQKDIEPLPFEKVEPILRALHPNYEEVFIIEKKAMAAASIGQVHKALLKRETQSMEVVIKLRYPTVEKAMSSDFRALKALVSPFLKLFTEIDLDPVWEEIRKQLARETDYNLEARYQREFHEKGKNDKRDGIVPEPLEEYCGEGVIVSVFEPSIQGRDDISKAPQELRNKWGEQLFTIIMRQVLIHGKLHADPNLGNFGFRENGDVILYDFGQVKEIPEELQKHYKDIITYGLEMNVSALQNVLYNAGIKDNKNNAPLNKEFIEDHLQVLKPLLMNTETKIDPRLGIVQSLIEVGQKHWSISRSIVFPPAILFVQRTLVGLLGNIQQLGPSVKWGHILKSLTK